MSERLEFVKRWLDGERVVDLCREYGVSRKTAYKMRARYDEFGPRGLTDIDGDGFADHVLKTSEGTRVVARVNRLGGGNPLKRGCSPGQGPMSPRSNRPHPAPLAPHHNQDRP